MTVSHEHIKYKLELVGGPKDGHYELVKFLPPTLEYYTAKGRIAIYVQTIKGCYIFDSYKQVLDVEAPEQKIRYYPNYEDLNE
jgi:hypothetical protein